MLWLKTKSKPNVRCSEGWNDMPKYKIVVLVSKTELIEVEAENERKAMDLAEDTVAESYNHHEWSI